MPAQPVDATHALNVSAGVANSSVLRGRSLSCRPSRLASPDPKAWLFPTALGPSGRLSNRPMSQADVYRMIRRRADAAGIETQIGCHSFRATGITEYLRNDQVSLDEVERIRI